MTMNRRDFILRSFVLGGSLILPAFSLSAKTQEPAWRPSYEKLERAGKLAERVRQAHAIFEQCQLCPRRCGVNRIKGERGYCRAPVKPMVFSLQPHFGEEVPLVGESGSGTIFFSNCNLRCVFCQNWPISIEGHGKEVTEEELAEMMIQLQEIGCHNINLVTPTHVMPNILGATRIALQKGLQVPLVYNTSGYERVDILKILDGVVDIYLPDMKYMDENQAGKYSSGAFDYPQISQKAIVEMHRQVGGLRVDQRGIALRGLIIRHLVMPNRVAGTEAFVKWVAANLPKSTYVNIMAQYRVEYKAYEYPEIARGITVQEFLEAMNWAESAGLTRLDERTIYLKEMFTKTRSEK